MAETRLQHGSGLHKPGRVLAYQGNSQIRIRQAQGPISATRIDESAPDHTSGRLGLETASLGLISGPGSLLTASAPASVSLHGAHPLAESVASYLKGTRQPGCRPPRKPRPAYLLSDRLMTVYETPRPELSDPGRVYAMLADLTGEDRELLVVFCLNTKNGAMLREIVNIGILDQCTTAPREILKPAVLNSASGIIIAHNHPSGDPRPSAQDVDFTRALKAACDVFRIRLLDHVIFAHDGYFSMQSEGML